MDSPRPHEPVRRDLDLLVWDAPNIDMTLSSILGSRPASSDRPRFDAIARWFLSEAADHEVEGCVFTNVHPTSAVSLRGWIEALRSFGYAVFARPKVHPEDDVDDAMLQHIASRQSSHRLRRVVVASGDGRTFLTPWRICTGPGSASSSSPSPRSPATRRSPRSSSSSTSRTCPARSRSPWAAPASPPCPPTAAGSARRGRCAPCWRTPGRWSTRPPLPSWNRPPRSSPPTTAPAPSPPRWEVGRVPAPQGQQARTA